MNCYECAKQGIESQAVALCKHCQVGLCMKHIEEDYQKFSIRPKYGCSHILPTGLIKIDKKEAVTA